MNAFFRLITILLAATVVESRLSVPGLNWRFWQCPVPGCVDVCSKCNENGGQCITEPTYFGHYTRKCRGCDKFVSCACTDDAKQCDGSYVSRDPNNNCEFFPCPPVKKCCEQAKPPDAECGRSGCTCCSDGEWVLGNSGPSYPAEEVCKLLDMEPSEPCTVGCTDDAKQCPGGSYVSRDPNNNCEFFPCPTTVGCTDDAKQCPDGSSVSRDPNNNCEFFPCPTSGEPCGKSVCEEGLECCNASCGICVKPGDVCIQIVCDHD